MDKARKVTFEVLYNGSEVGLTKRLKTLTYTDNASGTADEVTLTFSEKDGFWIRDRLKPEKGADLDVTLWFEDWEGVGGSGKYHCGNFTLDDISFSGPPATCTIKGVSLPAEEGFQSTKVSKTWNGSTLKQIANEIKDKYGMSDLYYWGDDPVIPEVEQDKKPDSTFISELCEKMGMCIKVYKKALVIFSKKLYWSRGITRTFHEDDFEEGWSYRDSLFGTYTGVKLTYVLTKGSGKKKKSETISVTLGEGPKWMELDDRVETEADAIRLCESKVNDANEKATALNFTAMGDPDIVATCNIKVIGMGLVDGKYYVERVQHTFSEGHTMKVSAFKVFDRL